LTPIFVKSAEGALPILPIFCYDNSIIHTTRRTGGTGMNIRFPLIPYNPLVKIVLAALFFILAVGLMLNFYLDPVITSLFKQQISPLFEENLTVGSLHLSLWQGSLILNNVSLKQPKNFGTGPMIAADTIKIRLELMPLFQKKLNINSITLIRPHVHWVQQRQGTTNFEYYARLLRQASKPATVGSKNSEPLEIHLDKVSIINGTLSFTSPRIAAKEPAFALKDLQIRVADFQLPNPQKKPAQFHITGTIAAPRPGRFECSGVGVFLGESLEFSAKNRLTGIHLPDYGYLYPDSQVAVTSGTASVEGTIDSRNNYITSTQQVKISGLKIASANRNIVTRTIMGISANAFIRLLNDKHKNLEFAFEVQGPVSQLKVHLKENITTAVLKSLSRKLGLNKTIIPHLPDTLQESSRKLKNKLHSILGN